MKLIIDRKRWLRGRPYEGTLLNENGKMCCMGFFCLACGHTPDEIEDMDAPSTVLKLSCDADRIDGKEQELIDSNLEEPLAGVNDWLYITDEEREPKIAELFAKIGVEVEFVD